MERPSKRIKGQGVQLWRSRRQSLLGVYRLAEKVRAGGKAPPDRNVPPGS